MLYPTVHQVCGQKPRSALLLQCLISAPSSEPSSVIRVGGLCRCKTLGVRLLNRRLSDMATRALAHFAARAERAAAAGGGAGSLELSGRARAAAAVALEDLLLWLASYRRGLAALPSCILAGVSVNSGCVERACR